MRQLRKWYEYYREFRDTFHLSWWAAVIMATPDWLLFGSAFFLGMLIGWCFK